MDSMTNGTVPEDKKLWCEFGCEVRIYYDHIEFSDGLRIPIPRNVKTDKIHNCPNLDQESEGDFFPHDLDVQLEMEKEQDGHFWDQEEVNQHFFEMEMNFQGVDGLEFKNYRDGLKEFLVEKLNEIPDVFDEIRISNAEETLPACLQTEDEAFGMFQPVELLGKFYEMDGSLEDAKKCYEIQKEIAGEEKLWSNRIEETDEQLRMKKQESLIKKQGEGESKKPQTLQQKDRETKDILAEILEFERTDLKDFAFANMSKPEFKTTLDEMHWFHHENEDGTLKTWTDMVRSLRKKNIDNLDDGQDRDDWDILSFKHKIIILTKKKVNKKSPFIKKRIVVDFLYEINNYRNSLAHPFKIPKPRNITDRIIRNYIDYCRDYFENSRNA